MSRRVRPVFLSRHRNRNQRNRGNRRSRRRERTGRLLLGIQHALTPLRHLPAKARGDDGNLDLFAHLLVQHRAKNDVRVLMRRRLNQRRSCIDLGELQRTRSSDIDQNPARAIDRARLQQRRSHRRLRRLDRAILTRAHRRAHHRVAHAGHRRLHVGKVAVDNAGDGDDVADALHTLAQHVVCNAEALKEARVLGHGQQLFVGNHDHRVHIFQQLIQSALRLALPPLAFKAKRASHHGDRKNSQLAGQRCNHRRGTRARATAQAGCDKNHVRAFQRLNDLFRIFQSRAPPHVGVSASAQAGGEPDTPITLMRAPRTASS